MPYRILRIQPERQQVVSPYRVLRTQPALTILRIIRNSYKYSFPHTFGAHASTKTCEYARTVILLRPIPSPPTRPPFTPSLFFALVDPAPSFRSAPFRLIRLSEPNRTSHKCSLHLPPARTMTFLPQRSQRTQRLYNRVFLCATQRPLRFTTNIPSNDHQKNSVMIRFIRSIRVPPLRPSNDYSLASNPLL